ncbi:MAG TPA: PQQ-binding-like beta-propeller repeat protein [Ktedonobacteraceae bacterium]|jgi:outer membrane protein assembly factor BamB
MDEQQISRQATDATRDQVDISDLDAREFPLSPLARRIHHLLRLPSSIRASPQKRSDLALMLLGALVTVVGWPWLVAQRPQASRPPAPDARGIAPPLELLPAGPLVYVQAPDGDVLAERADNGHLLWRRPLGASPDCATGAQLLACLVTGKDGMALQVLDAQDGRLHWSRPLAASAAAPALQVAGDQIYASTHDGWLEVLRAADGARLWSYHYAPTARPLPEFLTIVENLAVVRTSNGVSHLLRSADGSEIFQYVGDGGVPQIGQGIVYLSLGFHAIGETDGTLQALRATDGRLLWHQTLRSNANWAPVEIEGTVYAGSPDGAILAFAGTDGRRIWTYRADQPVIGAPTGQQGRLYTLLQDGSLVAIQAADGGQRWRTRIAPFARFASYTPRLSGERLFLSRFTSRGSLIYSVQTSDGSIRWFHDVGSDDALHAPVLLSDIVYLLQNDGSLDAWRVSDGAHLWRYSTPTNPIQEIHNQQGLLYLLTFYNSLVTLQSSDGRLLWRLGPFAEP